MSFAADGRIRGSSRWRQAWLPSLICFGLIFDSGGDLGLRTYAVALVGLLCLARFRHVRLSGGELTAWVAALVLLTPSLLASIYKSVPVATIVLWTFPMLAFPLVLVAVRASRMTTDHFVDGGLLFALVILILFYGRFNQIEPINAVHDYFAERSAGFFNEKKTFLEEAIPVVYFQGTLALVMCAVLAIARSRYLAYVTVCAALIVAPSRFGAVLALLFGLLVVIIQFRHRAVFWLVLGPVLAALAFAFFSLPESFVEIFSAESEGSTTRLLHLSSVLELIDDKPYLLLTGDGPGTMFFSKGFNDLTDNIEISQLEILRKFGLPFSLAFTTLLAWLCLRLLALGRLDLSLAIAAHYLVALSNPVLFSLPATFLLAIAVTVLYAQAPLYVENSRRRRHLQPVGQ